MSQGINLFLQGRLGKAIAEIGMRESGISGYQKSKSAFTPLEMNHCAANRRLPKGSLSLTGFTLIELLIALGIFAIAAVTLYSTFFAGVSIWKRSGDASDIYQDIRAVFDDIARDLKNSVYITKDKESDYAFSGAAKKIVFMTLVEDATAEMEPVKEMVRVFYYFDDAKSELVREEAGISTGFDAAKTAGDALLKGVEGFKFEYCYDTGDENDPYLWLDEWEDEDAKTPRGVRVTALIKCSGGGKAVSEIARVILIPTGALGKKEL